MLPQLRARSSCWRRSSWDRGATDRGDDNPHELVHGVCFLEILIIKAVLNAKRLRPANRAVGRRQAQPTCRLNFQLKLSALTQNCAFSVELVLPSSHPRKAVQSKMPEAKAKNGVNEAVLCVRCHSSDAALVVRTEHLCRCVQSLAL